MHSKNQTQASPAQTKPLPTPLRLDQLEGVTGGDWRLGDNGEFIWWSEG